MSYADTKHNFPIFDNHPDLIYLDNASTTHKPRSVLKSINRYYNNSNSNIDGFYSISGNSTELYNQSRSTVASFIGASKDEVVFTSGATDSLNMVAGMFSNILREIDEVVITKMEHHSNLIPWQELCVRTGASLKFVPIQKSGDLDISKLRQLMNKNVKVVSISHVSNVLGTVNDIKSIAKLVHEFDSILVVDGAQAIAHIDVDVSDLDCDFYAFSGHKMYGPMGVGVLYAKKEMLDKFSPTRFGGKMVEKVACDRSIYTDLPYRYEAGTPNIAGAVGLASAIEYIRENHSLVKGEIDLIEYTKQQLKSVEDVVVFGESENQVGVVSFVVRGVDSTDIGIYLAKKNIAIRVGTHCAQLLIESLGEVSLCRVSLGIYNTQSDIDTFISALKAGIRFFKS